MRKIVSYLVLSFIFVSSTAFAAPLTDFGTGKSSVDIGIARPNVSLDPDPFVSKMGKETNFDFGITTGLNDNVAIQYKYQKLDTAVMPFPLDAKIQELNALYRLNSNTYAFVGMQKLTGEIPLFITKMDTKTVAQFGITTTAKLSDKLDGWATAAVGKDTHSYEIGVGYALSSKADLNLFYRYKKFRNINFETFPIDFDETFKGLGASVSVKF